MNFRDLTTNYKKRNSLALLLLTVTYLLSPIMAGKAFAVPLTNAELRFYRLATATPLSATDKLLVKFTPGAIATENEVRVTFDGDGDDGNIGYIVDNTAGNIDVSTTGLPAGCNAAPGIGTDANAVSGASVDFTVTDLTASTTYCFFITSGITSPTNTGSYTSTITTQTGSDVESETTDVTVSHISDQVIVTAVVPSSFTVVLGATSTSFIGDLSATTHQFTTGVTLQVTSNAANGWSAFLKSANGSLDSADSGDTIATTGTINDAPSAVVDGAEHYLLDVDETTDNEGVTAIDAEYNGNEALPDPTGGTFNDTDFEQIASATGPTDSYVMTMKGLATISVTTEPATDYTDTWTVIASGNF